MNRVSVLGTTYTVEKKKYTDDEVFERCSINGYCDAFTKKIVYCDMDTYKGWEHEEEETKRAQERITVRHEIVHAFFNESGLMASAHEPEGAFSLDEELIDWVACQGEKIYKAWKDVGCLDNRVGV